MSKSYPNWFLWIYERGFAFWIAAALLFLTPLLGVALYLDDQLDDAEYRLQADLDEIGTDVTEAEDKYMKELAAIRQDVQKLTEEVRMLRETIAGQKPD